MRRRSPALLAALVAALAVSGCSAYLTPDEPIDWLSVAGRDLNCDDDAVELVAPVADYDIDGDGVADQFVTMRCRPHGDAGPEPSQLEVFRGGSSRDNPARMAVIIRNRQGLRFDGCLSFVGRQVFIPAVERGKRVVWVASWNGKEKRMKTERHADSAPITGCS